MLTSGNVASCIVLTMCVCVCVSRSPSNFSLFSCVFCVAAADDDQNALTMLGNMEAKDNSRMSLPAFDQVRDQYNGSTYKLPKNFSLSDMANFT